MKLCLWTLSIALLAMLAATTFAAERTIILSVPSMNCPSCPYMVEKSISFVEGVLSADAELKTRTCTVTFDDAVASVEDIINATANIGYESSVLSPGDGS